MYIQKSENLIKLIRQRKEVQDNADKAEGLKARQTALATLKTEIEPLVQTCILFRQNNMGNYGDNVFVENLIALLKGLQQSFESNPVALNQARSLQPLTQAFTALQHALKSNLESNWKAYVDSQVPVTSNELMGVLGRIPAFSQTVETVRELLREIAMMRENLPRHQTEIERLATRAKTLNETWQKLGSDDVPPAVLQFLREAVTDGAHLHLLTDEVTKWLTDYKINSSFRIRLR